jgi:cell division protein FtsB
LGKRVVPLLLIALLAIVHAQLWFGRGSVRNVAELQRELDAQKAANAQAVLENARLQSEVRDLKEGQEMVEERARAELGMVKPNEILVQIAKSPASAASTPRP